MPGRVNGKDTFVIVKMVPVINTRTNEVVGGVGCLLVIDGIQGELEKVVSEHDEIAIMVIYSNNGFILSHVFPQRVGMMMPDVDVEFGRNQQTAFQAIQNGRPFKGSSYDPTFDTNIELIMKPFRIGNSDQTWSILIGTAESYILQEVHSITRFTVFLAVLALLIAAIAVYIFLHYMTRPIVKVANTLEDIAHGEGDLTQSIPVKGNDEISRMSHFFNITIGKIRNLVAEIKQETIALSGIGTELASNMNETAAAINQITANIQSIKSRVINQSASVTETNATMEQITINIHKLNEHVEKQTASVSQSSSSVEEMLANIKSVTQTLIRNSESVNELSGASEVGRSGLQNVAGDIQEIARESEGLLEINSVMENIASQTNLLSMNAAIEAAHAGEAGKGFAVVADEIRKLAENSSGQSKTISTVLKKMKSSIDKITMSTANVLNKFEAIDSGVKTVALQEENIRNAMEEQGQGSKQILDAISQVNETTRMVKGGATEMLDGAKEVILESQNLEKTTQEISGGMNEMATGAEQINIAVNRVNELSVQNRENISLLMKEVSKFKVE
jgi:methyl-accepting chemotaxis protein